MRLIDEEALMEDIQKTITEQSGTIDWLNLISRQPTAYDVDKVVKQVEKYRGIFESRGTLPLVNMDYAVEVVRNGGKEQE